MIISLHLSSLSNRLGAGRGMLAAAVVLLAACDSGDPSTGQPEFRQLGLTGIAGASLGADTTCVVTESGQTKCWGHNDAGQLGRGDMVDIGDDETPDEEGFIALGEVALQVVTNGMHSYAVLADGRVRAWGDNTDHALGLPHTETIGDDEAPGASAVTTDVSLGRDAQQVAVGEDFACARLDNGTARCWGANDFGQLGRNGTARVGDDELPSVGPAIFFGAPIVDITAGRHHACALVAGGQVRCWGRATHGQLGYGGTAHVGDDEWPLMAGTVQVGGVVTQVVAGGDHTCALLDGGSVRCWGLGAAGQLGHGDTEDIGDDEIPANVAPVALDGAAVALAAGREHTCALLDDGDLQCWGEGGSGQLGYGNTAAIGDGELPQDAGTVDLGDEQVTAIYGGSLARTTCASLFSGSLRCWGDNTFGQLGYGHLESLGDDADERPGELLDVPILVDNDA